MKINRITRGFSLIEVMIAITIIGIIGVISLAIFNQTLRTSGEASSLSNLKQNGEQVMRQITEAIRNAEAVVCYGPPDNTYAPPAEKRKERIVVRTMEGKYVRFRFVDADGATKNGYIARLDNLDVSQLSNPANLTAFCGTDFSNSGEIKLTNDDTKSGVSITDGRFAKVTGNTGKDTVFIGFNVNPALSSGGFGTDIAGMQTTVQVR